MGTMERILIRASVKTQRQPHLVIRIMLMLNAVRRRNIDEKRAS